MDFARVWILTTPERGMMRTTIVAACFILGACTTATGPDATNEPTERSITVSPLSLNPPFSPSIHDYTVRCAAGKNPLTIDMLARSGTARLVQPTTRTTAASQSVDVELDENEAAVVEFAVGDETHPYWIRCLPHDFPVIVATRHPELGAPSPGWYLASSTLPASAASGFAMVVDANGTPVWYRRSAAGGGVLNVDLLPGGVISYTPLIAYTFAATTEAKYELHRLDPPDTRYVGTVGMPTDHHELRQLPNGRYLVLSDLITTDVDLTGLESFGADSAIINCAIQEVDDAGTVFWSWLATDHFDTAEESTSPSSVSVEGQNVIDPFHCNSIDVDGDGNLLVSARHMNSVFLIDRATGNVRWKIGGSPHNKDGARYIRIGQDPGTGFYLQHDARFRPTGNISLFDDHGGMPGFARCVEYAIDLDAGIANVVWQSTGAATSAAMGSCRRYQDGSTVIGWGLVSSGRSLILSDVDASGNDLLDLEFAPSGASYRALKVPSNALDPNVLRNAVAPP